MRVDTASSELSLTASKNFLLACDLSGAPDKSHTRRHFHQALDNDSARMGAVLVFIARLYAVEKSARQAGIAGDDLRQLRQQGAVPVLE